MIFGNKINIHLTASGIRMLLLMVVACCMQTKATSLTSGIAQPFLVVTKDSVTEAPQFTDDEFYRLSASVIFKVNSTQINANDEFYRIYRKEIVPLINARDLQLRKIFIRGAASPEGPYANNQRLARGRSAALLAALKRELSHQYHEVEIDVNSVTEDYGYLCVLMKNKNDRDYDIVKNIYNECGRDELCCKERLMKYGNGTLWRRLLTEYFPQLRAARLILWFSEPDERHAPPFSGGFVTAKDFGGDSLNCQMPEMKMDFAEDLREAKEKTKRQWRHVVAARTNLVHDCFVMPGFGFAPSPNLQFEVYPLHGHLTYNVGITWGTLRHWETQEFWQVRDIQAELRRYFKGYGQFRGFYLGAYLHGGKYGIGLDSKQGWQGEYGGAGFTGGYTMPLTRRGDLRLEFMVGLGAIMSRYDPYVYGNPVTGTIDGDYYYNYLGSASDFKRRNHQAFYVGPTNIGIQLTYDIIYRKMPPRRHRKHQVQKGGAL